MLGLGDGVPGMDTEAVDEFTRHSAVVRELFDRQPLVMDDADAYLKTWTELKKHMAKLKRLDPPRAPGGL